MTKRFFLCLMLAIGGCMSPIGQGIDGDKAASVDVEAPALERFESQEELSSYLHELGEKAPPPVMARSLAATAESTSPAANVALDSQNNQVAGVLEGAIWMPWGYDHMVVLRQERLFLLRLDAGQPTLQSWTTAYPEGAATGYYDEILIHGNTIVVIGFNYNVRTLGNGRGATEVSRFDIVGAGASAKLVHRDTSYLSSNDYFSSNNYASRLIDGKLTFYTPHRLIDRGNFALPGICHRRWITFPDGSNGWSCFPRPSGELVEDDWGKIVSHERIYRPIQGHTSPVLHTVVTCDLDAADLDCSSQGIIGPATREYYVARDAVYLWVNDSPANRVYLPQYVFEGDLDAVRRRLPALPDSAIVYRLPLDVYESAGAARVVGHPSDQFSFHADASGNLHVLVQIPDPENLWYPVGQPRWWLDYGYRRNDVALVSIPAESFQKSIAAPVEFGNVYRQLGTARYGVVNRFVGSDVVFGSAYEETKVTVAPWDPAVWGQQPQTVELGHNIERIEVMGGRAVVIGNRGGDLHFSAVDLGASPRLAFNFVRSGVAQGESRSHGFFFKASAANPNEGILALPVTSTRIRDSREYVKGLTFLKVVDNSFVSIGGEGVFASGERQASGCTTSCTDWYGNTRPIFLGERRLGLIGWELVEMNDEMQELGRVNFNPTRWPALRH